MSFRAGGRADLAKVDDRCDVHIADECLLVSVASETFAGGMTHYELQQGAKLTAMLSLRVKELRKGCDLGIGPEACKELKDYFNDFLLDHKAEFPFDVSPEAVGEAPIVMQMEALAFGEGGSGRGGGKGADGVGVNGGANVIGLSEQEGGSLLPPLRLSSRGDKALTVKIVRMGFKDATEYIDPYMTAGKG